MLKFRIDRQQGPKVYAHFYEEPEPRYRFLTLFLDDISDREDFYLAQVAKAEAGEAVRDLNNFYVRVSLFPDLVVIEDLWDRNLDYEGAQGPPLCIFVTLQEAKQLILDWVEAKRRWFEDKRRREAN